MTQPFPESLEYELTPILPDNLDSLEEKLLPLIENTLRQAGYGDLMETGNLKFKILPPYPDSVVIHVLVHFGILIAYEFWREVGLPYLKKLCEVEEISKRP